jgi:hypothetical protein
MTSWRPLRGLLLGAALLLTASCGADGPTSPTKAPVPAASGTQPTVSNDLVGGLLGGVGGVTGGLLNGLLSCSPQPYASTTQTIGPAGGIIRVGRQSLVIPAGALNAPVQITAEVPSDEVSSVRFSPEGLQFNRGHSPVVTLDYSSCPAGRLQIFKHVAYTTERLQILNLLTSLDNLLLMKVSAPIEHFSRYAVAW